MSFLHHRVRMHRWVAWWMVLGVVCGIVAVTNILEHSLTRSQERVLILTGVMNWILGGVICYASEGIRIEPPSHHPVGTTAPKALSHDDEESHAASDFLLPGSRKSLLPPKYR
jgi:hypothetical protein